MFSSLWSKIEVSLVQWTFSALTVWQVLPGSASTKLDQIHVLISSSSQLAVCLIFLDFIPIWPSHKPIIVMKYPAKDINYNIRDFPDCYPIYLRPALVLSLCPPASPYFKSVSLLWIYWPIWTSLSGMPTSHLSLEMGYKCSHSFDDPGALSPSIISLAFEILPLFIEHY